MTKTELDDILRTVYKDDLGDKDLMEILHTFKQYSNNLLIDIKKFKEWIGKFQKTITLKLNDTTTVKSFKLTKKKLK